MIEGILSIRSNIPLRSIPPELISLWSHIITDCVDNIASAYKRESSFYKMERVLIRYFFWIRIVFVPVRYPIGVCVDSTFFLKPPSSLYFTSSLRFSEHQTAILQKFLNASCPADLWYQTPSITTPFFLSLVINLSEARNLQHFGSYGRVYENNPFIEGSLVLQHFCELVFSSPWIPTLPAIPLHDFKLFLCAYSVMILLCWESCPICLSFFVETLQYARYFS